MECGGSGGGGGGVGCVWVVGGGWRGGCGRWKVEVEVVGGLVVMVPWAAVRSVVTCFSGWKEVGSGRRGEEVGGRWKGRRRWEKGREVGGR